MAGGSQPQGSGIIAGINVTPLVDIMLVLLIIFLVTAKLQTTPPHGIPLTLPKSSTGDQVTLIFAIALGKDGEVAVNAQRLANDDAILPMATAAYAQNHDVHAVIQADGKVLHERMIHVLDLLAQAGITQVAFGITKS